MALTAIEKRRGGQDKYAWQPFQPNTGDFNTDWWERRQPTLEDPRYVQVIDDEGDEVARIELDDEGFETTDFAGAPDLGEERLEIQFFEVSSRRRGQEIGTRVVGFSSRTCFPTDGCAYQHGCGLLLVAGMEPLRACGSDGTRTAVQPAICSTPDLSYTGSPQRQLAQNGARTALEIVTGTN